MRRREQRSPWVRAALVGAAAGLLLTAANGCRPGADGRTDGAPRHLLLVTVDTLRADRVGAYGYASASTPAFDALAERGWLFENATTVMPLTLPAHSSLMTGTFPAYHGVRDNGGFYLGDEQRTLAEELAAAGLRTGGFVSSFVLDSRWGIAQGFDRYHDDFDLTLFDDSAGMDAVQRRGDAAVDEALAWLAADLETPFFAWVHLYDPHTPYEAPEPYRSRFPATLNGAYDAEVAYADAQLARLVDALAADGRLEETLVVVAGDHGEMLGEHDEATHGFFVYDAAIRIPLVVAGPGVERRTIAQPVRIVDLAPTILERFGHEAPSAVQGVDLAPAAEGERLGLLGLAESWFPRYHYGWSELTSIQDERYKLIRAPRRELYDLTSDPGELDNLAETESARADAMEGALERLLASVSSGREATRAEVDPETAQRLAALGYVGGATSARYLDDRPRGDPKDKIGLYNRMKVATAASAQGRLDEAIEHITEVLAADPEIVEAHLLLGNFRRKEERFEQAIEAYRAALELDPEHREAVYSLALAYKEAGRLDDAMTGLERAHGLDPRNGKVLWQLADVEMRRGRLEEAEERLVGALDLDLDRPRFLLKLGECYLELERPDEARRRLEEALAENPTLATAHYHLGLAEEAAGRPERAIAAYRREVELHDDAYRASFNLAKLYLAQGRADEAVGHFRRTVEIRPAFGTGHLYLAKGLLDRGDLEGAEAAARRGLANDPDPRIAPLGHYVLADVYNRQGQTREAEAEIAAARRLEGSSGR